MLSATGLGGAEHKKRTVHKFWLPRACATCPRQPTTVRYYTIRRNGERGDTPPDYFPGSQCFTRTGQLVNTTSGACVGEAIGTGGSA
jgi:hypothetical protein